MKTTSVLAILATALLTVNIHAAGPKGGSTRQEQQTAPQHLATDVDTGAANANVACSSCAAMSGSSEMAMKFCQVGTEITCPSCKAKTVVHKLDKARPQPSGKAARNVILVNEHGENCLIVSKAVS